MPSGFLYEGDGAYLTCEDCGAAVCSSENHDCPEGDESERTESMNSFKGLVTEAFANEYDRRGWSDEQWTEGDAIAVWCQKEFPRQWQDAMAAVEGWLADVAAVEPFGEDSAK